jgi:hypothetical protein
MSLKMIPNKTLNKIRLDYKFFHFSEVRNPRSSKKAGKIRPDPGIRSSPESSQRAAVYREKKSRTLLLMPQLWPLSSRLSNVYEH